MLFDKRQTYSTIDSIHCGTPNGTKLSRIFNQGFQVSSFDGRWKSHTPKWLNAATSNEHQTFKKEFCQPKAVSRGAGPATTSPTAPLQRYCTCRRKVCCGEARTSDYPNKSRITRVLRMPCTTHRYKMPGVPRNLPCRKGSFHEIMPGMHPGSRTLWPGTHFTARNCKTHQNTITRLHKRTATFKSHFCETSSVRCN